MTVYLFSVIIILFLSILLFEIIEIRLTVKEKLTVTISGVFLSLELSGFFKKGRKKKKAPSFPALFCSLKFFLGRAQTSIYDLPKSPPISSPIFGIYRVLISLLFAYSEKYTGKLILPENGDKEEESYLDLSFKARVWVIGYSFVIYIIRKTIGRFKRVRE